MSFIRKNFSPVGSQSRRGVSPQQFSYITRDTLAAVKANGYFPRDNESVDKNGMLNVFTPNDVISVIADAPPEDLTTQTPQPELSLIKIAGDGANAGAESVATNVVGSGYSVGDLLRVNYTDGTVLRNTIIAANNATVTAPTIVDPGQFDPTDPPTNLTALTTTDFDGASGTEPTVDIVLTNAPDITVWPKDINEA